MDLAAEKWFGMTALRKKTGVGTHQRLGQPGRKLGSEGGVLKHLQSPRNHCGATSTQNCYLHDNQPVGSSQQTSVITDPSSTSHLHTQTLFKYFKHIHFR